MHSGNKNSVLVIAHFSVNFKETSTNTIAPLYHTDFIKWIFTILWTISRHFRKWQCIIWIITSPTISDSTIINLTVRIRSKRFTIIYKYKFIISTYNEQIASLSTVQNSLVHVGGQSMKNKFWKYKNLLKIKY